MPAMTKYSKAKVPMSVGVDPTIIRRLDAIARRDSRPRAEILRRAIDEFLTREEPPEGGSDAGTSAQRQRRTRR